MERSPRHRDFYALFLTQTTLRPDARALQWQGGTWTYAALRQRSEAYARVLARHGVGAGARVAVSLHRSPDMIAVVLAVLRLRAAYVPLDPTYPQDRVQHMVRNAEPNVIITEEAFAAQYKDAKASVVTTKDFHNARDLAELPDYQPAGADLIYIIYTSGSTGVPKGVSLGRDALSNLIQFQIADSRVGPGERTLQFTPLSFDVSFQEIFATLCAGGTLVLVDEKTRLDPRALALFLKEQKIHRLYLPFVALNFLAEIAVNEHIIPAMLREVITAGEQLQINNHVRAFFSALPSCTLFNHYGPSETHVVTTLLLSGDPASWPDLPAIGEALPHTEVFIVDEQGHEVPDGVEGEIWLAGDCLAEGYFRQKEMTSEKFIMHSDLAPRIYRTGDMGSRQSDGLIYYHGRRDTQVKINGFRVELGEIEVALTELPGVRQAAVVVDGSLGTQLLQAYIVLQAEYVFDEEVARQTMEARLPEYMRPQAFNVLMEIPRTPSGKIDRRALPQLTRRRPELSVAYVAPESSTEKRLAGLWTELLRLDQVGIDDSFFALGGHSLLVIRFLARLKEETKRTIPVATFFEFVTIRQLARFMDEGERPESSEPRREEAREPKDPLEPIAIVGMAGRFPGAIDVSELWRALVDGKDLVTRFSLEETAKSEREKARQAQYVRARGMVSGIELFDSRFFGITPREADVMDPQHRLFLEESWHALEDAGVVADEKTVIGVFAGMANNTYAPHVLQRAPEIVQKVGAFNVMLANEKDYLALRVAHALNLKGPALSIHTACSTSLVAVIQAVQALREQSCDVALAGGIALTIPQFSGHIYQDGDVYSRDGVTRPFAADSSGTVFSDGVAVVVLKRLSAALRDGDGIYAVIKGTGLNNDGSDKVSFMGPSIQGQAAAIAMAHAQAGVSPDSIQYVEAHGTGTSLGDPVEVEGLTRAFRQHTSQEQFCALGSIKGNIGHLTAAAGAAGLIKTALALKNETIPASLHAEQLNPRIPFQTSPFYVAQKKESWPRGEQTRLAGVSSFGVGGTNAHVVVEEAPAMASDAPSRPLVFLPFSALRREEISALTKNLAARAKTLGSDHELADMAFTLQAGRKSFVERGYVLAATKTEAAQRFEDPVLEERVHSFSGKKRPLLFLFPGQGAQYAGMGKSFYEHEKVYRAAVDACAAIVNPLLGEDIRAVLWDSDISRLNETRLTQPALFITGYAMARLWQSWGILPERLVGHSVGEFVAAVIADIMSLEDALCLVARRGALVQAQPPGAMLSVPLSEKDVRALLPADVDIAAVNAAQMTVVSGENDAVTHFASVLEKRGISSRRLHTSHAFHSRMMDPVADELVKLANQIPLSTPKLALYSSVIGRLLTNEEAKDPQYWGRHLRQTVRFQEAMESAVRDGAFIALDCGPRGIAAQLARLTAKEAIIVPSMGDKADAPSEYRALFKAVGQLWLHGFPLDWRAFYGSERRVKISLPGYPFVRRRHWVDVEEFDSVPVKEPAMISQNSHRDAIMRQLREELEEASGLDLSCSREEESFLDLGMNSLFLTQAALNIKNRFAVDITFRRLMEDYDSLGKLADFVAAHTTPKEEEFSSSQRQPAAEAESSQQSSAASMEMPPWPELRAPISPITGGTGLEAIIAQQLQLMQNQLALLQGRTLSSSLSVPLGRMVQDEGLTAENTATHQPVPAPSAPVEGVPEDAAKQAFGAIARISHVGKDLSGTQRDVLQKFAEIYTAKTKGSKEYTQRHRAHLADPRVVTGFRPALKELTYPLVVKRSQGSRLWDVDGNEYIDMTNGFGSNFFGYGAEMLRAAAMKQLEDGIELGPQHVLVGEVAEKIKRLTGNERVAFCNTGSEAVLGAMRVARTITGRKKIACFSGSYHGINDEVIIRKTKKGKPQPAAPGIMQEAVHNMMVLDYGEEESLRQLRAHAHELAAILVEPVQSRRPEFVPIDFLKECRRIADEFGCALIFDEVITGFRYHPAGVQEVFGVRADLTTYGKVIGGGMPIGVIAGRRAWMDALDGGFWQFGDASQPEVGVTYFAGTFVRHPLAIAAANAVCDELLRQGPALQESLNKKAEAFTRELNAFFARENVPLFYANFGSLMKLKSTEDIPYLELLACFIRNNGVHLYDGFPTFFTTAHSDADIASVTKAFKDAVLAMKEAGFFGVVPTRPVQTGIPVKPVALQPRLSPPVPGARLGRDKAGNPAWFVADPERPGQYMQIGDPI